VGDRKGGGVDAGNWGRCVSIVVIVGRRRRRSSQPQKLFRANMHKHVQNA